MIFLYIERLILVIAFFVLALVFEGCAADNNQRYSDYYDGCSRLGAEFVRGVPEPAKLSIAGNMVRFCTQASMERFLD